MASWASTGLKGLDETFSGLNKGDNVVWQVDSIEDYQRFVTPYVKKALADKRKVVYMRFAEHPPLIQPESNIKTYTLDARGGFEGFSTQIHAIITHEGPETYYVFDCLSDLLNAWATDLMIGNFFRITCPYLFDLDTIAYFALLRSNHSFKTIARIRETTQLLIDVYNFEGNIYVHPLKVWRRYSPTMFLPHLQKEEIFSPIVSSMDAAKLFSHFEGKGLKGSARTLDYWDRLFMKAETLRSEPEDSKEVRDIIKRRAENICQICGKEVEDGDGRADHSNAHAKGGKTDISNSQWTCNKCNSSKGAN